MLSCVFVKVFIAFSLGNVVTICTSIHFFLMWPTKVLNTGPDMQSTAQPCFRPRVLWGDALDHVGRASDVAPVSRRLTTGFNSATSAQNNFKMFYSDSKELEASEKTVICIPDLAPNGFSLQRHQICRSAWHATLPSERVCIQLWPKHKRNFQKWLNNWQLVLMEWHFRDAWHSS